MRGQSVKDPSITTDPTARRGAKRMRKTTNMEYLFGASGLKLLNFPLSFQGRRSSLPNLQANVVDRNLDAVLQLDPSRALNLDPTNNILRFDFGISRNDGGLVLGPDPDLMVAKI